MSRNHLVRVGAMGHVGPFAAADASIYPRGSDVILRTQRGLERGLVLASPHTVDEAAPSEGQILRGMTVEDQLLQARLEKNRDEAFQACTELLRERQIDATLLDVEQLFDGQSLFFYFLGEVSPEVTALTKELAAAYEAEVQMHKFSETLSAGCGPGCGTEEVAGSGCVSCTTCAVASACGTRRKK